MRRYIAIALLLAAASWALLLWTPEQATPASLTPEEPSDPAPVPSSAPAPAPPRPTSQPAPQPTAAEPPSAEPPSAEPPSTEPPSTEPPSTEPPSTELQPTPQPQAAPAFKLPKLPPPRAQGPVSALKLRFGNESASEASKQQEQQLAEALQRTGPPLQSIETISCRRSVCRINWRWKPQHIIPFGQALGALHAFDPNPGVDEAGPANSDGTHAVDIYVDVTPRP